MLSQSVKVLDQSVQLLPKVSEFLKGKIKLFIDGKFVESADGKTFNTTNPATGEIIAEVYEPGVEDAKRAIRAARTAFDSGKWSKLTPADRSLLMYKLADLMEENLKELAQLETLDNGKPLSESMYGDVPTSIEYIRYFAGWCTKNMGQNIPVSGPYLNYTRHEPVGVVGAIVPWNFPLLMAIWKLGPAFAAGCTVVLKPAQLTPLTALYLGKLAAEAGFPEGAFNVIPGSGRVVGNIIVESPDVNKISFTGSTVVGKSIVKRAADTMKRVTMELGGKSPNIILPDADLSKAIPGVFNAIMGNTGEVCSAGSRVYVHKDVYDEVIAGMVQRAKSLKLGNGLNLDTEMGPIVSKEQFDSVSNFIKIGKEEGGNMLTGGSLDHKGFFITPTIFDNVNENMTIVKEEIFGPVVVVMPFSTEEELIERANNSIYGLGAGIWTENVKSAHTIANRLQAGSVWINCYNAGDPGSPFGGYKQSGFGRDRGTYALDAYTEVKSVWVNLE